LLQQDLKDELSKAAVAEIYRALRNLAYDNMQNVGGMASVGGITAIKQALSLQTKGPDLPVQALGFALNLAIGNEVNVQRMDEAGVLASVVKLLTEALDDSEGDVTLLATLLETLLIFSTQAAGQKGIAQSGSAKILVQGLKKPAIKTQVALSRSIVAIVGNVATDSKQCKAIIDVEGPHAVVTAMKAHHEDPSMQEAAAGALRNFCVTEHGRLHTVNAEGINAIIDAMRTHAETPAVLQNGISALINLVQNNNANKAVVRRAGIIPMVKSALMSHSGAQALQEVGLFFLQELGVKSL